MSDASGCSENKCAWLEYTPEGSDRKRTIQLDQEVFTIGRSDQASVQIDSTKVSREHAQIVREEDRYQLRDLGSTNGTFVNGASIEQTDLQPGDVIAVADAQFSFLTESVGHLRKMATQAMPVGPPSTPGVSTRQENAHAIAALRAAHEQLRCGCTPVELTRIIELPGPQVFAYVQKPFDQGGTGPLLRPPSHALARLGEARRQETIRSAASLLDCRRVVVPIDAWEVNDSASFVWHIEALLGDLPPEVGLVVSLRANEASDLAEVQQLAVDLGQMGVEICCRDFIGNHVHVERLAGLRPLALILGRELAADLDQKPQRVSRLRSIVEVCRTLAIRPVAEGQEDRQANQLLIDCGVDLLYETSGAAASDEAANAPLVVAANPG